MKHKKVKFIVVFLMLFSMLGLKAQETTDASGGEASGSGGTVSYSVGQIVYTTSSGTNGSVAQGVQQPYEISVVLGIEEANGIHLMTVFPNPTTNFVVLKVENYVVTDLIYQLIDTNGRLIESKKILGEATTVDINNYPATIYFLQVLDNNKAIKTFKIIKN